MVILICNAGAQVAAFARDTSGNRIAFRPGGPARRRLASGGRRRGDRGTGPRAFLASAAWLDGFQHQ